jgi:hypothetical protein
MGRVNRTLSAAAFGAAAMGKNVESLKVKTCDAGSGRAGPRMGS